MRITAKGQVTIPIEIRKQLELLPNTEVEFELARDGVIIRKVRRRAWRGERVVAHLRGRGTLPLSTDQILALTRDG
jgi:antitoxin PrlF